MQAVILAGGLGTRLAPFTDSHPKPMYPFKGRPFLEYLIRQLKDFQIQDILILASYRHEEIEAYFRDGAAWGVRIAYDVTPVEYDTGARIRSARAKIKGDFLLLYCDNYCPINLNKHLEKYRRNGALVQITAYENADQYTKGNLKLDGELVTVYDKRRTQEGLQQVDIGYALVSRGVLDMLPEENVNFEAFLYPQLVRQGKLFATTVSHRYYSIGSWSRIELTEKFLNAPKVVFLDRDGTINRRAPRACYIEKPEDFVWLDGAIEAIRRLNQAGYLVVLVTNQPGIARGNLTEVDLAAIHQKMQDDLARQGAHIDAVYHCPHNWDEGCACRKPKAGMLFQAQRELCLDLSKSILIGDDERDMEAAKNADCPSFMVDQEHSLLEIVRQILEKEEVTNAGF